MLVPSAARAAASAIPTSATGTPAASAASTITTSAARTPAASAAISAVRTIALRTIALRTIARRTIEAGDVSNPVAVEVRFGIRFVGEISATFNHHRAGGYGSGYEFAFRSGHSWNFASAHFRALLFENRLTR